MTKVPDEWQASQIKPRCTPTNGNRVDWWCSNISARLSQRDGEWHAEQLFPNCSLWTSLWQSAHMVGAALNSSDVWQAMHCTPAWRPTNGNPVVRWSNGRSLRSVFQLSVTWQSLHFMVSLPCGLASGVARVNADQKVKTRMSMRWYMWSIWAQREITNCAWGPRSSTYFSILILIAQKKQNEYSLYSLLISRVMMMHETAWKRRDAKRRVPEERRKAVLRNGRKKRVGRQNKSLAFHTITQSNSHIQNSSTFDFKNLRSQSQEILLHFWN